MANRQGDVDLRFAQSTSLRPQLELWLGLACKHSTLHVFCCSDDNDVDKQIQPASDTKIITYFSWTEEYIREFCNESFRHHRTALFRDTTY